MRAFEILREGNDYVGEIETALTDLLASVKANGITEIPTEKLVYELNNMGYNVDIDSIMEIVGGNPFVQVASKDAVTLKGADDAAVSGDAAAEQSNKDKVKSLAQKAVAKDMK